MVVRDENYIHIGGWMLTRLGLKGNSLLAYAIIHGFSQDGEGEFTGSINYLCEWMNVSRPTVSKALDELVEKGYVIKTQIVKNRVKFNTYKVNLQVVKNLVEGSKESLQGSKESLHNNTNNNTISKNTNNILKENKQKKSANALPSVSTVSLETEFETLWKLYPKKQGKSNALRDYIKARKDKKNPVSYEQVLQGLQGYLSYLKAKQVEERFIKQGSTWFHQRCWEDEYRLQATGSDGFEPVKTNNQFLRMLQEGRFDDE